MLKWGEARNSAGHRRGGEVDKTNSERKEASQRDWGLWEGRGVLLWPTMAHIHILDRPSSSGWPPCLIDLAGTAAGIGIQFWCFSSWRGEGRTMAHLPPNSFPISGFSNLQNLVENLNGWHKNVSRCHGTSSGSGELLTSDLLWHSP